MTLFDEYYGRRTTREPSKRLLFTLLRDMLDRQGIGDEIEGVEDTDMQEMLATWLRIIRNAMGAKP